MTETAAPTFALAIAYWLHMLATVAWIGGLVALSVVLLPAARRALDPQGFSGLISQVQVRMQRVGWFSLVVLVVTGMFQMSSHPSYGGFLTITNSWAVAILIKHLVIGGMVLVSAYATWGLLPALQRSALRRAAGREVDPFQQQRLERREEWLLRINLVLSIIVLALTAWARAAG